MTDRSTERATDRRQRRWVLWQQLPLLVALVLLWMALWREATVLSVGTGIVVAVVVSRTFWLPPVELSGRFNPLRLAWLMLALAGELVRATAQIAALAVSPGGVRTNAIVEARLATRSDFVLTLTAIAVSLVPGSIVIEVDRDNSTLFLHALGVRDEDGMRRVREQVARMERRVVLAVGSREDVGRLR